MSSDSLGDRMKNLYENRARAYLTRRTPVIMRLDGKSFHTFTKGFNRPFDDNLHNAMVATTIAVFNEIQGAKLAYTQSDEISILITDFERFSTEAYFDYNIQKMCSVAASVAAAHFNARNISDKLAYFDCRVFNIPENEVRNYFIWRQKDWYRNSVQMVGQANFSHKELHQKKLPDIHEMLHKKGINWATDYKNWQKNGTIYTARGTEHYSFTEGDVFNYLMERIDV